MARALEQNPKTLPPKALRQWEHVYESAQARGLNKQGAAAQAWCAVKRKYKKSGSRWVLRKKPIPPSKQPPGCVKARRRNPPKVNYAIIADERPVGWWSRPVRIVTRDEAIDCQRGIQGRCIALVGAKDRVSAESMLADLERAKIEVATPKGQVVYSGSLLDFDSEAIRPYLNFVDAGRILQLALGQSSEVKLASGKLRARIVAANNPAKKKRPTFAAARQAIFAELGAQGWTLKPSLKTPQAQKDIDGHLVILHFKPEAVWMEIKNETTSRSTHSDIREFEPRAWVATIPRWMAIDLKLQRDLDANPGEFMAGDWVVVELSSDAYLGEVFVGRVLDDGGEDPDGAVWYRVDTNLTYQPQKFFRSEKMRLATDEEREDAIEYWQGPLPVAPLILQRGTNPSRTNPPPSRRGRPGEQSWGVYHPLTGKETFYAGYNEARARKVAIGLASHWPGLPVEYRGYVADSDGRWQWGELQSARNPRDESFIVQQYFGESSRPSWEGPLEDWIDAHPSLKSDTLATLREMRPGSSFTLSDGTLTQTIRRVDEGRRRVAAGGRMRRNTDCGCDHGRAKRMMNPRSY